MVILNLTSSEEAALASVPITGVERYEAVYDYRQKACLWFYGRQRGADGVSGERLRSDTRQRA